MSQTTQPIIVEVERRHEHGKNAARRLRVTGRIPGILYGLDRPPFAVAVSAKRIGELLKLGSGRNTVFTLQLDDGGTPSRREAMIRELQRDPMTDLMIHVDFVRVDPNKAIVVKIPVRLLGIPVGVKLENGLLDFVHREVTVECLPGRIPEHIDVDVSALHVNEHVSVSDLPGGEGVRVIDPPETIVAVVATTKAEETPAEAAAAAGAVEPEVIKKGGKETEGQSPAKEK